MGMPMLNWFNRHPALDAGTMENKTIENKRVHLDKA